MISKAECVYARFLGAALLSITLGIAPSVAAQEGYRVSTVVVSSGQTPTTSGLAGTIQFRNDRRGYMEVTVQQESARFMFGRDFGAGRLTCSLYGTVGYFQGAPFVSPYFYCGAPVGQIATQRVFVGGLIWPGFYLGREPDKWRNDGRINPEPMFATNLLMANLNIGGFGANVSYLNVLDDPWNFLPGVSYAHPLNGQFRVQGSGTWNSNSEKMMYYIGLSWQIPRPNP
ncbi:MAG: hypothetical protein AB7F99_03945 [Vicinamibacterales bacterium]